MVHRASCVRVLPRFFLREQRRLAGSHVSRLLKPAELDLEYLCNPKCTSSIRSNIASRKGSGDIDKVVSLHSKLLDLAPESEQFSKTQSALYHEAFMIPNRSHPNTPVGDESCARVVHISGTRREFTFNPKSCVEIGKSLEAMRLENTYFSGPRAYYLIGDFARLERALINYTVEYLQKKGFLLVSVPDLLPPDVISACGFVTTGPQNQIYRVAKAEGGYCLAGTAEMSLASYFMNQVLPDKLPIRVCAWSRCFRAEEAKNKVDKDFYRVHQFTKVEMFGLTSDVTGCESEQLLQEFVQIQMELFEGLGIPYRLLEMPTEELGRPAYRKYDIEAWMPAKKLYGEISSASNCTDYQSRRLHIKYQSCKNNHPAKHVHTVNGTGCAVPRMIISIVENNQQQDGSIDLPSVLRPYLGGQQRITAPPMSMGIKWIAKRSRDVSGVD